MLAVQTIGNISERVRPALQAGCDGLLICNNQKGAISALETPPHQISLPKNICKNHFLVAEGMRYEIPSVDVDIAT